MPDAEVDDSITQKFETFIVFPAHAFVGQGQSEQSWIHKTVAELFLKFFDVEIVLLSTVHRRSKRCPK